MTGLIHPTAVIAEGAQIAADVRIGPFCVVGPDVVLAAGVELRSHVVLSGDTHVGAGSRIFPFAVVGEIPQDLKYAGERSRLRIGERTTIREHATIHVGTAHGGMETRIGDDCLIMGGAHVAHDVQIGNRVILVNHVGVAGHCVIEDDVIIGGLSGIHQWVRIGRGAIIGGLSAVTRDVIPHGLVEGPRATLDGLNLIGLKRRGVDRVDLQAVRAAYQALKDGDVPFLERARQLQETTESPLVREIVDFVLGQTDRQFLTPV